MAFIALAALARIPFIASVIIHFIGFYIGWNLP